MATEPNSSHALHKKSRRPKRTSDTSEQLSIEELFPDDMAYDADIEIVRPNQYEDADSEPDSESDRSAFHTIDEELADRMRRLGNEKDVRSSTIAHADRGRKRSSKAFEEDEDNILNAPFSPEFEVHELVGNAAVPSPAKRRKKRSKRFEGVHCVGRNLTDRWSESSGKHDRPSVDSRHGSFSPTTTSDRQLPDNTESMDIT